MARAGDANPRDDNDDAMTLPDGVRYFLLDIVRDDDIETLARKRREFADSPDLNETWISDIRYRAARLLEKYG
jgi:uncharacterized protein YPO0396